MKQTVISKLVFASLILPLCLVFAAPAASVVAQAAPGTCTDRIDNDQDGRIDWTGGVDASGKPVPPDPSCVNENSQEVADLETGSKIPLIPCVNKCDLGDVLQLLNNLIAALIKVVLFPVAIFMFIYLGYQYIVSQGNANMHAKLRSMVGKLILGMLLILCAWLIVKTLLVTFGYTETLYFFE